MASYEFWCSSIIIMYYNNKMAQKYSNTPRGAQDKQLLALTQSELPWTPADYKTRGNNNKPVSIVWDLLGVTPTICNKINDNEYNKVNS